MALVELQTGHDILVVEEIVPGFSALALFNHWIQPDLLCLWWPPEAEIDARLGGAYHLTWPQQNWHLRGHYTSFEPGKTLGFIWRWDHEPAELPTRDVLIQFAPDAGGGTKLTLTHSVYGDSAEEQEQRASHLAGWQYFFDRLQNIHHF